MHWNYRVVNKNGCFGIHEVFFGDNKKIGATTEDPIEPFGETETELKDHYKLMGEAFNAPVINYDDIPQEGAEDI